MQLVSLVLGRPNVGWLPVEIRVNDFLLSFEASDIGLNVIDQLAEMLMQLNAGCSSECHFYLEPGAYLLNVELISNIGFLQIQFVEEFDNPDISTTETIFHGEIDLIGFRKSLRNALRVFRNLDYRTEDWPTPEKNTLLNQLLNS